MQQHMEIHYGVTWRGSLFEHETSEVKSDLSLYPPDLMSSLLLWFGYESPVITQGQQRALAPPKWPSSPWRPRTRHHYRYRCPPRRLPPARRRRRLRHPAVRPRNQATMQDNYQNPPLS